MIPISERASLIQGDGLSMKFHDPSMLILINLLTHGNNQTWNPYLATDHVTGTHDRKKANINMTMKNMLDLEALYGRCGGMQLTRAEN